VCILNNKFTNETHLDTKIGELVRLLISFGEKYLFLEKRYIIEKTYILGNIIEKRVSS
jgi:hypothetical protein